MARRGRSALLLLALILAGCGTSHHAATSTTTAAPPPPPAPPPPTTTAPAPPPPSPTTTAPAPPPPSPPAPRERRHLAVGVDYDCLTDSAARRPRVFKLIEAAGVGWVRINTNWRSLEPGRNRWSAYLPALDQCVSLAARGGLATELIFISTPEWAGPDPHAVPSRPATYARTIEHLARRYRGRVRAWEVWAEQNTDRMWKSSPAAYARLLRAAYPAVKQGDPGAQVVFGGTYGNDADWIRQAYAAGAKPFFDVMATHPYTDGAAAVAPVRRIMKEYGDSAKPVWFTEMGYSAPLRMSLAAQARRLTGFFSYTREHLPYVKAIFWFQIVGANPHAHPWEHDLEILNGDLTPRPAYFALSREAR